MPGVSSGQKCCKRNFLKVTAETCSLRRISYKKQDTGLTKQDERNPGCCREAAPHLAGKGGMGETSHNKRPQFYKAQVVFSTLNECKSFLGFFFLADNTIFKPRSIKLYIFVGAIA